MRTKPTAIVYQSTTGVENYSVPNEMVQEFTGIGGSKLLITPAEQGG